MRLWRISLVRISLAIHNPTFSLDIMFYIMEMARRLCVVKVHG